MKRRAWSKWTAPLIIVTGIMIITGCAKKEEMRYTELVDPFIGTAAHGHTFPGAVRPFSMVQLSPDTHTEGWDWCSGYHSSDSSIIGFSHTHLSGTGIGDFGDVLLMPSVGDLQLDPGTREDPDAGYRSRFRHSTELADPGYYGVHLDDYDIGVELTTTRRAGFHRYVFPETDTANILIDLHHGIRDHPRESMIRIVDDRTIEGYRRSSGWAKKHVVYFVAEFSVPFDQSGTVRDGDLSLDSLTATGRDIQAFVRYTDNSPDTVLVRVGISPVSTDGARKNLRAELPDWDFNRIRTEAREVWEEKLSRIEVQGGTQAQQETFYTALYHAMLGPYLYADVDGRYLGIDRQVHQSKEFENYTAFSLWDTFRAAHPLYTLLEPERTNDFIRSLLAMYHEGGMLPIWPLAGNYTWTMIGNHSIPVIVDAYAKGIRDYDIGLAYEAMRHSAESDRAGLDLYREYGYIPANLENESVSKTLEYAYNDWALAQMAGALGKEKDAEYYGKRAGYYRNVFDPGTKFMRGKRSDGSWVEDFDPLFSRHRRDEYTEGNAWQYTWFVPHDVEGLIELMGGRQSFLAKLDSLFTLDKEVKGGEASVDISGLIGQYAHGNEPSHHIAYMYNVAGAAWKTQDRVRQIMNSQYGSGRDGLSGNEDFGQMSAWFIFSAMGFYPMTPGDNRYQLGSPIFDKITIHLPDYHYGGTDFVITARGNSPENRYIQSARLDGQELNKPWFSHTALASGGHLELQMGNKPGETFK